MLKMNLSSICWINRSVLKYSLGNTFTNGDIDLYPCYVVLVVALWPLNESNTETTDILVGIFVIPYRMITASHI